MVNESGEKVVDECPYFFVFNSDIMNMTADKPLTLLSFFVIFELIAFSCGTFSAFTKFCAKEATSTPEPAPKELMIF